MTEHVAGLDVSLETTTICVIDGQGRIVLESSVATDPDLIAAVLAPHALRLVRLEAGPMSEWLHTGLAQHGLETVVMETRQVRAALKASQVKTDRRDACGIAHLLRMGWFRPVHVKTVSGRERRVLLGARDTLVRRTRDLDNSVRGLLRSFGLRPPRLLRGRWSDAVRQLIAAHPMLATAIEPILVARDKLARLDRLVRDQARDDAVCRRLTTVPGVGAIVALSYVVAIDDPTRFARSRAVGPVLGLTPSRYQSGATDRPGTITKAGDARARVALFEAAHVMMIRVAGWFPLKAWAMRVAARRGAKRAKVALARRLAVILHRMWVDGTDFQAQPA
ncbi:MAG: IS110 family transposase [Geminicoccaceae bacterium]